uniref:U44-Theraphotoxin-Ct1b_1 n=1 Tax=Coremiocnemis tropix TaxID=1904443 RepID=A0A482Z7N2_CORTR
MKALLVLAAIFVLVEGGIDYWYCEDKMCGENRYCCGMKCTEYKPEGGPCYHDIFIAFNASQDSFAKIINALKKLLGIRSNPFKRQVLPFKAVEGMFWRIML